MGTFTSLISRDATYKAMTKSWKKAQDRQTIRSQDLSDHSQNSSTEVDAEEIDGKEEDDESLLIKNGSFDSINSSKLDMISQLEEVEDSNNNRSEEKETIVTSVVNKKAESHFQPHSMPYNHILNTLVKESNKIIKGIWENLSPSLLLCLFIIFLIILLVSSFNLADRLEIVNQKIEEHAKMKWRYTLKSHSSMQIQEYLDTNLKTIRQVQENLRKLVLLINKELEE